MFISVAVGILAGTIGSLSWSLVQLLLNSPNVYGQLAGRWHLVAIAIGCGAAALYLFTKAQTRVRTYSSAGRGKYDDRRLALADLLESYYFGVFRLQALTWIGRALVTLACALFGGIFGIEGFILEATYSTMPLFLKNARLFIEERQTFVICTIAAAIGVGFGTPFAGIVLSLELLFAHDAKVRWGAIVATLVAYGTAMFWQSTVLSNLFAENTLEGFTLLGALFGGARPVAFTRLEWFSLTATGIGLGALIALLANFTGKTLARGSEFFTQMFGRAVHWGMVIAGLLIALSVWLVPESMGEPWKLWEDIAWLRLSSFGALTIAIGFWGILVLAFSGWGSSGVFAPMLVIGSLIGYAVGNSIGSSWVIPLSVAGAAAMFSSAFRTPFAAVVMVLEVGRGGPAWWVSIVAVLGSLGICRLLRFKPLHEVLLERRGIRVVGGRAASVLAAIKCADAMYRDVRTVAESSTFQELREAAATSNHAYLGVISSDAKYLGLLSLEQLPPRLQRLLGPDARQDDLKVMERIFELRDVMDPYVPTVLPGESLEKVLNLLEKDRCIAVVDEHRMLSGFVFESSVVGRYNREIASYAIRLS